MVGWQRGKNIYIKRKLSQKHNAGQRKQSAGQYANIFRRKKHIKLYIFYGYTHTHTHRTVCKLLCLGEKTHKTIYFIIYIYITPPHSI